MTTPTKNTETPTRTKTKLPKAPISESPTIDSGIQRRISDILVTFHQCVQTWELNNQASFNTANTLCNLYSQWDSMKSEDLLKVSDVYKRRYYIKLIITREDLLKQMQEHKEKLEKLMNKMMGLIYNLKAMHYLGVVMVSGSDLETKDSQLPIFKTWTVKDFYCKTKLVFSAYTKEYYFKKTFYDHFFEYRVENDNQDGTNILIQCINYWLHQPYIDDKSNFLLEAMLAEADLK